MPAPSVALRPTGGIVFFESENFGGRQFTIDQPDPNFGKSHASERQQSAVVEKRLAPGWLRVARWETAAGAALTQLIMIGVLIAIEVLSGFLACDAELLAL